MGANDVTRVVGRTTDQIAEERIARLNEALAARERERPVMTADKRSHWDDDRGTISASNSNIPRDMTLVDFLETGRNLRRGEYAKTFNNLLDVAALFAGMGAKRYAKQYKRHTKPRPVYEVENLPDFTKRPLRKENPPVEISSPTSQTMAKYYWDHTEGQWQPVPSRWVATAVKMGFPKRLSVGGIDFDLVHRSETNDNYGGPYIDKSGRRGPGSVYYSDGHRLFRISDHWAQEISETRGTWVPSVGGSYWTRDFSKIDDGRMSKYYPVQSAFTDINDRVYSQPISYTGGLIDINHLSPPSDFSQQARSGWKISGSPATSTSTMKDAFEKAGLPNGTHEDAKGGDARADAEGGDASGSETAVSEPPVSEPVPQAQGGPRIVINPTTFHNKKDALCVAFNEGFRLWMEANDFQPQSEPTDRQRRFFSDTAYADDELQLRRTILARIATFDTSVKDPTDDQLTETAQFLDGVLESGWCKNEWEQDSVSRLSEAVKAAIGAEPVEPREEPLEPAQAEPLEPAGGEEVQALQSGGSTDDEEEDRFALQNSGQSDRVDQAEDADLAGREADQAEGAGMQPGAQEQAQGPSADLGAPTAQAPVADAPRAGKPASPGDEPTEEQARQAEIQNEKDLAAAAKEYDRMKASGKLDSPRAFGEAARPKLTLASPVSPDSPGSIAYRGPRRGDISQPVVGSDFPGSIAYRRPKRGDISQPVVGSDSPGSISFSGARDRRPGQDDGVGGGIENPVVSPDSPGSISNPVLSYAPGSIESPVDDQRRKEERRKRRDRRRRGLL